MYKLLLAPDLHAEHGGTDAIVALPAEPQRPSLLQYLQNKHSEPTYTAAVVVTLP